MNYTGYLQDLQRQGNLRTIPQPSGREILDFSTNDYLGLNVDRDLHEQFISDAANRRHSLSSTASRLLASDQRCYSALEDLLGSLYGRSVLLFNSGYHANTGVVSALADSGTLILADKLVHASIIDGIILSRSRFTRFRHNDWEHLERLIAEAPAQYETLLVIVESVYSMDGDMADISRLIELKRRYPRVMLYVDEAHAVGVLGRNGLGLCVDCPEVDVIVGTMGKALASMGAYVAVSDVLRRYLLNTARSFIFSTALPPMQVAWSHFIVNKMVHMDDRRAHLADMAVRLADGIGVRSTSHIVPVIVGDAHKVVGMSGSMLADDGVKVLPIRRPTVAAGTERLRISLSAAHSEADVDRLIDSINRHSCNND